MAILALGVLYFLCVGMFYALLFNKSEAERKRDDEEQIEYLRQIEKKKRKRH